MQFSNKQTLIAFSLVVFALASPCLAQQDDKALVAECLKVHADEFQPLAHQRAALYQSHSNYLLSVRSILRWLEQDPKTADARRLKEIAGLEARLQALKDKANLTSQEGIKDVAATVEATNVMLEELKDQHDLTVKPLSRKFTALQRKYKTAESKLKPVMLKLFREQDNSEATADAAAQRNSLNRSYGSFSYSSGTASGSYKREGENTSAAICYIYLVNEKVAQEKNGLFASKYPIAYRSKNQLEVLVGNVRVTISSSDPELNDKQLDATLTSLVDFEALEEILAP